MSLSPAFEENKILAVGERPHTRGAGNSLCGVSRFCRPLLLGQGAASFKEVLLLSEKMSLTVQLGLIE